MKRVGPTIRRYRKAANLSQEQLGSMIPVSREHVSYVETQKKYPSLELRISFGKILKIPIYELLEPDEIFLGLDVCHPSDVRILHACRLMSALPEENLDKVLDVLKLIAPKTESGDQNDKARPPTASSFSGPASSEGSGPSPVPRKKSNH